MPARNPAAKIHQDRYIRNRAGETVEEIAKRDKVTERAVQDSLRLATIAKTRLTTEFMRESLVGVVIEQGNKVNHALSEALIATTTTEVVDKDTGKKEVIHNPDHQTRLQAVDRYVHIATAAQPKGGGQQTSVNVGVGVSVRQASGIYVGSENRLREIREKMKDAPRLEEKVVVGGVIEAPEPEMITAGGDDDE